MLLNILHNMLPMFFLALDLQIFVLPFCGTLNCLVFAVSPCLNDILLKIVLYFCSIFSLCFCKLYFRNNFTMKMKQKRAGYV